MSELLHIDAANITESEDGVDVAIKVVGEGINTAVRLLAAMGDEVFLKTPDGKSYSGTLRAIAVKAVKGVNVVTLKVEGGGRLGTLVGTNADVAPAQLPLPAVGPEQTLRAVEPDKAVPQDVSFEDV